MTIGHSPPPPANDAFALTAKGVGDEERLQVAWQKINLELLPRNQWGGLPHLPEMTAAFVQPNDITVERLLQKAADLLRGQGKDPALNGYSVGSAHAWEIDPALWEAVAPVEIDVASLDPKDRLARWLRKLLDLSLRNNLLKLKARKKAVRLEASDPGVLLDPLASGQQIKLHTHAACMVDITPQTGRLCASKIVAHSTSSADMPCYRSILEMDLLSRPNLWRDAAGMLSPA